MKLLVLAVLLLAVSLNATEYEIHGTPSKTFKDDHNKKGHNPDADHQAILGSKKMAHEFDDLSPDESKKRLRVLANKMDVNKDGFVDKKELTDWIYNSLLQLDEEETRERFEEVDTNKDEKITWTEYVKESFGVDDMKELDAEYAKLMAEDRIYFDDADRDHDGVLTYEEFQAFQNPEHYSHMHGALIANTLAEKDANKDGKIDVKEFLGDVHDQPQSEFYLTEKSRFTDEYDKNKDGFLSGDELNAWLIPDIKQTAVDEAEHLIESSSKSNDDKLSIAEIVSNYAMFVGSEATNYGEQLSNVRHEEL